MSEIIAFIMGIIIGSLFVGLVQKDMYIDPCELNLPRTQHCVLTAIPEEEK